MNVYEVDVVRDDPNAVSLSWVVLADSTEKAIEAVKNSVVGVEVIRVEWISGMGIVAE